MPKTYEICWAIRTQPNRGLRTFSSTVAEMSSADGPFGPGLRLLPEEEKSREYLSLINAFSRP